jgi:multidrug efflux system membrane fusion protein
MKLRRLLLHGTAITTVIAVAALAIVGHSRGQQPPGNQPPASNAVPVTVTKAERQDLPVYARGIGTVQAWQSVQIRAQVNGYLQSINFTEGQDVKAGDLLAMIDPRPYQDALDQAKAKRASDAANLANDQLNEQRDSTLARSSYASIQQVDNDKALVSQFQATVQSDDAAMAAAQLNLEFCRITAPVDGVVGFRQIDIGNLVQASSAQPIVTLTQIRPVAVVFTLAQEMLPQVREALADGKTPVRAFAPDDKNDLSGGTLLTPNNSIDVSTGTISLKAVFPNEDRKLWPGQFVNAHLRLRVDHDAVVVPTAAVQHGPDGLYVFVVKSDNTVAGQPVTVGYQDDRSYEITKGLNGGEEVVLDGQSRLQNGTTVTAKPAA